MKDPPKRGMVRPPTGGLDAGRPPHQRVRTSGLRTASSRAWLERQLNDPFAAAARARGYRSRAAFKLTEIDEAHRLLAGARVIDLGCAPGGWLQVARERGAARIAGVDLLTVEALDGVDIHQGDFLLAETRAELLAALRAPPTVILSDMAPNTTGHRRTDHLRIIALMEAAVNFCGQGLAPGGALVCKAFQGGETAELIGRLKRAFAEVRHAKPRASRAESAEVYLIAKGFRAAS